MGFRGETHAHYVARPRLTDVVAANRVTVVEAGAGFGKSALAAECAATLPVVAVNARLDSRDADLELFVSRLRRALRLAGLSDLAAAANPQSSNAIDDVLALLSITTEPVLLVFDDVHDAESDELTAAIVDLAATLPAPHRMLILGRTLAGTARKLRYAHGVATLGSSDLIFRRDELNTALGPLAGNHAEEVMHATQGWPAAVVLAARRLERDATATEALSRITPHTAVSELVQLVEDDLSPSDRSLVVQLAHLPLLSAQITEAVTNDTDAWSRLTDAGLPLGPAVSGYAELPGPVRDILAARGPLDPDFARRACDAYCELGEIRAALDVVVSAGDYRTAAGVISSQSRRAVPPLEFSDIVGVVDAMPADVVAAQPRVLLVAARLAGRADRFVHRFASLSQVETLLAETPGNQQLEDEFNIEVAYDLLRLYQSDEAAARVEGIADRLGPDDLETRAQLLGIQGRYACRGGAYDRGIELLNDATKLFLQVGDREQAAKCTYSLATEALYYAGRLEEALDVTKQSLALAISPLDRLARLSLIADLATDLGRYEEAEAALVDLQDLAQRQRSGRWSAYVPWGHARAAAQRGDTNRAVRALREVERCFDEPWFDDDLRAFFNTDAADILGLVGEHAEARRCLEASRQIVDRYPTNWVDAMVEARLGDPVEAEAKFAALPEWRDRRENWRFLLLRAFAAMRRGDPAAGTLAADAFDLAAADGLLVSLVAREPVIAEQLTGLASAAGSVAAKSLARGSLSWTITLLGGFEVRHGGAEVALPTGKPTQAVKLVAAMGGRTTLDEVVDALWPEGDLETGRRGVRNLLNRLKPTAPDLLLRDGNDLILNPTAQVDADAFEAEARAAFAAPVGDPERTTFARSAMARYHGELLPSDRYESWSTLAREKARLRFGELIDLLIHESEASGETDEAVRLCERAIDVDPYNDERYLRAARLLLARGRRTNALAVIDRAKAMLAELGLEPVGELAVLSDRITGARP